VTPVFQAKLYTSEKKKKQLMDAKSRGSNLNLPKMNSQVEDKHESKQS